MITHARLLSVREIANLLQNHQPPPKTILPARNLHHLQTRRLRHLQTRRLRHRLPPLNRQPHLSSLPREHRAMVLATPQFLDPFQVRPNQRPVHLLHKQHRHSLCHRHQLLPAVTIPTFQHRLHLRHSPALMRPDRQTEPLSIYASIRIIRNISFLKCGERRRIPVHGSSCLSPVTAEFRNQN